MKNAMKSRTKNAMKKAQRKTVKMKNSEKWKESMITIPVKEIMIGGVVPKICVPMTPQKLDMIREEAIIADNSGCDLVEWRLDHLDTWSERTSTKSRQQALEEIARGLEIIRQETKAPVILTLRTRDEGGLAQLKRRDYYTAIRDFIEECDPDVVDIECFDQESEDGFDKIVFLTDLAKENGKKVILSNHDFHKTPPAEEIVKRLCIMDNLGADIPKVAYMPKDEDDVHAVIQAAHAAAEYISKPFIALSMSELGTPTRICGSHSGSAITFAVAARQSAPGQVSVSDMKKYISEYYKK